MLRRYLNWRALLALIGIIIVIGTIFYSQYLARKIAQEEREQVEAWVEAGKFLINSPPDVDTKLVFTIIENNKDIPIIRTDASGRIIEYSNLDSAKAASPDSAYLKSRLREFRQQHQPIIYTDPINRQVDYYYYGDSQLLQEVRYYPIVQLLIVTLFIVITIYSISTRNKSMQNQLWAGMAKETAHQLGTPVSSLQGWVEMLRESGTDERIVSELGKDIERLKLVSERFSKIGSTPQLEPHDVVGQINHMVDYIRKRAPGKVQFQVNAPATPVGTVLLSASLFDWVIENLLKNALDAMGGQGRITIDIASVGGQILIDVTDTGKGISAKHLDRVFKPGFTTKKRGWGLGLTLSKRIVEQYHGGQLFVKHSETGKGTTFRIVLNK